MGCFFVCPACRATRKVERNLGHPIDGKTMRRQGRFWQLKGLKEALASEWNIAQANRYWHLAGMRLQKELKSKCRKRLNVKTDGFIHREPCLTGEACISACNNKAASDKPEGKKLVIGVQVSDELIVVTNSRPEKCW